MLRRDLLAPVAGGAAALLLARDGRAQADPGVRAGGTAIRRGPSQALKIGGNAFGDMGGFVFRSLVELETDAQAVQLSFENDSPALPSTIDGVAVAPTGSADSLASPSGAFVPLGFAGRPGGVVPVARPSPGGVVLGRLWTDTAPLRTVPRTDGGRRPLLVVSVMALGHVRGQVFDLGRLRALPGCRLVAQDVGRWEGIAPGWMGDAENRRYRSVPRADAANYLPWAMLVTQATSGGVAVQVAGDSLSSGWMASDNLNAWLPQATAALSTPARPVSALVSAIAGEASVTFIANARADHALARPGVVLVSAFSPNNAGANIGWEAALGMARDFAREVGLAGGVPVLMAPYPWPDERIDADEAACRAALRALAAAGEALVFDPAVALSGGQETGAVRCLPGFLAADGAHLGDAGVAAVAGAFAGFLGGLLPA